MIQSLSHGRVLFDSIPSTHDLYNKLKNYPDSLILTVTRRSAANINDVILKHIFTNHPLALVVADDESLLPVHKDMKLMITRNVIMFIGFVNLSIGQFVTVTAISSKTIIATHPNGNIINIFPMSSIINNIQTTKYTQPRYIKSTGRHYIKLFYGSIQTALPREQHMLHCLELNR